MICAGGKHMLEAPAAEDIRALKMGTDSGGLGCQDNAQLTASKYDCKDVDCDADSEDLDAVD
jgi:hypothetical protein